MTSHWKEHKPHCVPLAKRGPKLEIDCSRGYLDDPKNAHEMQVDCMVVSRRTFPGVVVVKIQLVSGGAKICDSHGVIMFYEFDPKLLASLETLMRVHGTFLGTHGFGYYDADMSQIVRVRFVVSFQMSDALFQGRLIIYFDRAWKCTW